VFSTECFTELGIDVALKAVVVLKSSQHFRASFDRIARQTIYCNGPGTLNLDLAAMPYRKLQVTHDGTAFTVQSVA
jgi:microcystin degradation protein MlrC